MKKDNTLLNISKMNPWWLRLFFLLLIGVPIISGWPLSVFYIKSDPFTQLALWLAYGVFIWLFIFLNCGLERLFSFLSVASILGITTALSASTIRKIFPFISGPGSDLEVNLKMTLLLIEIITVVPYGLFFVNSFSVGGILLKFSGTNKSYKKKVAHHVALTLRIFQHVGEVLINLLCVWKEENPKLLLPRFNKSNSSMSIKSIFNFFMWFVRSMVLWSFAIFIFTINTIPVFVDEMTKYIHTNN